MTTPNEAGGQLAPLRTQIAAAQALFAQLLESALRAGPVSIEQYVRYLSMQYHLTKDVQAYFFAAAANSALAKRRKLRRFLSEFANEEELHYLVAANDLLAFGRRPLPEPFDVTLWHSYFRGVVGSRPFLRLGAAAILENLSAGVAREPARRALSAPFMTRENTKFLVLHQHETNPHGEQILQALGAETLTDAELGDLFLGARQGTVLYLRMARWAVDESDLSAIADLGAPELSSTQCRDIDEFDMGQLDSPD
ncbi:iron-containing redox enzyme family protein [Caenimonas terrae]|uniref:Iron-containing redox enzyme family protein n=1 Tax=Caenimonas terrae TaxID=696074 RepID=A0ABW0N5X8_9BURK